MVRVKNIFCRLVVLCIAGALSSCAVTVRAQMVRLEFTSTSDWAKLLPEDPKNIAAIAVTATEGDPGFINMSPARLGLYQSLDDAKAGKRIGVTATIVLSPDALKQPLRFTLEKGALNNCVIRAFDGTNLLCDFHHNGSVTTNQMSNPKGFEINVSSLAPQSLLMKRANVGKKVLAFYYPWYGTNDWNKPLLEDDHPLTRYSSDDSAIIAKHIEMAKTAGIDGFVSSWWGPDSYSDKNLRTLLNLAQKKHFAVTIYFETLTGHGPRDADEIEKWLAFAIETYRGHPAWLKANDKPVIVLWAAHDVSLPTWRGIFAHLRARGLDAFYVGEGLCPANLAVWDGIHSYAVFNDTDLANSELIAQRSTRLAASLTGATKIWCATVQPGYDDTRIPGRGGAVQPRDGGAFYRKTWDAALASDPDWIFITTWNEWWEHTEIEPGEKFGDAYLNITRDFAARWRK